MALRSVRYRCTMCERVTEIRFRADYKPFRRWLMSCWKCGRYALHRAINRKQIAGDWR